MFCDLVAGRPWTLLGSCEEFDHGRSFQQRVVGGGLGFFLGIGDYMVRLNSSGHWIWQNSLTNSTIGELLPKKYNYPVGKIHIKIK